MRVCCVPAGTGGVAFYRMLQPYGWLKKQGKDIFIFDPKIHDSKRLNDEMFTADVIVYQCPWSEGIRDAVQLIKMGKKFGKNKKVVVEFDDWFYDVSPWNEKYNMFGLTEQYITIKDKESAQRYYEIHKNDKWRDLTWNPDGSLSMFFWKDGHTGLDLKVNLVKSLATKEVLRDADLLTVTTMELGKMYRKHREKGEIAVLPNLIDFDRWLPMKSNDTGEIRIGWQGGSAHFDDLRLIINDLIWIAKKYPKVKFCFLGVQYDTLFEELGEQVEWWPWHGDVSTYPLHVREMKLDIGLCPLQPDKFNNGKSPLKWEEYSALMIPTIASPTVYAQEIKHGKTGFIANSSKEWREYIELLINNPEIRKEVARKANDRVRFKFDVKHSQMWWDTLEDLCKKESAKFREMVLAK